MATELEIANQALIRVGSESITALSDSNERARAVNASWPFVRTAVLRAHSWNCATTRTQLKSYSPQPTWGFTKRYVLPTGCERVIEVDTEYQWRIEGDEILTDGTFDTQTLDDELEFTANPSLTDPVVCFAVNSLSAGDVVYIEGSAMAEINGKNFLVANPTGIAFELTDEDGSDGRALTTASTIGGAYEVTTGDLNVRYVQDISDPADFDSELTHVMAVRLAAEICERITDSTTKRQSLLNEFEAMLKKAKNDDGQEQSPAEFEEDDWVTVRY